MRRSFFVSSLVLVALAALVLPEIAAAQDLHPSRRPSPMAMARTHVGDAYVRVVYSRPYLRGRDNIFGTAESEALVPFGQIWRTGANEATHFETDRDLVFGTGADNCVWVVDDAVTPPAAERVCPVVTHLYTADPPAQLRERLQGGAIRGMSMDWPSTLPVYIEHAASSAGTVLLRPFRSDSLVLQRTVPDPRDVAVAPLDGFVGCKAAGCLWVLEDPGAVRLIVLERAELSRLVERAPALRASRLDVR